MHRTYTEREREGRDRGVLVSFYNHITRICNYQFVIGWQISIWLLFVCYCWELCNSKMERILRKRLYKKRTAFMMPTPLQSNATPMYVYVRIIKSWAYNMSQRPVHVYMWSRQRELEWCRHALWTASLLPLLLPALCMTETYSFIH